MSKYLKSKKTDIKNGFPLLKLQAALDFFRLEWNVIKNCKCAVVLIFSLSGRNYIKKSLFVR